jgi:hypothetical protein
MTRSSTLSSSRCCVVCRRRVDLCNSIKPHPDLAVLQLPRIYFYHAPPITGKQVNPLDRKEYEFGNSSAFRENRRLLDRLELEQNFARRLGQTQVHGWRLGTSALRSLQEKLRQITAEDLMPNITQRASIFASASTSPGSH